MCIIKMCDFQLAVEIQRGASSPKISICQGPEKNTKQARDTITLWPEKERCRILAEYRIRWCVLKKFLNRAAYAGQAPVNRVRNM